MLPIRKAIALNKTTDSIALKNALQQFTVAMLTLAQNQGIDIEWLLQKTEISREILAKDETGKPLPSISNQQFASLFVHLKQATGDESYGYDSIVNTPLGNVSLVYQMIANTDTLHSAMCMVKKHAPLMRGDLSNYMIEKRNGLITYGFKRLVATNFEFVINDALNLYWWYRACEWLIDEKIPLDYISVMGNDNTDGRLLTTLFDCPVILNAKRNCFAFPQSYGNYALIRTQNELTEIGDAPEKVLGRINYSRKTTYTEKVRRLIKNKIDSKFPSLNEMATLLNCSNSTLRRRLSQENTSFQAIKDQYRLETATKLLAETNNSISEIANALGFANASALHKAMRKWTGKTPSELRTKNR